MDHAVLKRRARLGVLLLLGRTVVLQVAVFLGGTLMLARLLEPRDFGIFAIVQFAMQFFTFFGEAGLGAALIQQKTHPTERELSTVFHIQLGVTLAVVAFVWISSPWVHVVWADLPAGAEALFRALSVSLVLTVLRAIPSILMERELLFGRLAVVEIVTTLAFYGVAVTMAFLGYGVWSLVVGTLTQGVAGLLCAYAFRPWWPRLLFDKQAIRPILRFGIPVQTKHLIGFVNSAVTPGYAGSVLGATQVGFLTWAQQTAYFPLRLVEIMGRVTFPLLSRMQGDPKMQGETLGRALQICALGTLFFVGLVAGAGPEMVRVVFLEKWMPAVPLLYVFAGAISIGFLSPLIGPAFDATGRPGVFMKLVIGWTVLNWLVVIITTPRWGVMGFALGYSVHVVLGNIAVVIIMMKLIPGTRPLRRVWASVLGGGAVWFIGHQLKWMVTGFAGLTLLVLICLGAFALIQLILDRKGISDAISMVPRSGTKAHTTAEP